MMEKKFPMPSHVSEAAWDSIFGKREPLPAGRNRLYLCQGCGKQVPMGMIGVKHPKGRDTVCYDCTDSGKEPL